KTIPLRDIISQLPLSIVITTSPSVLPIEDPEDSLITGNEDLNTIPEKESDKVIKSSVEDLVPIPSESEIHPGVIDVPEDNVKIYSSPLFKFDDEYIFSDVNPFFDEVLEDIENKDSYIFNLDEPYLLVPPLSNANKDECFDPGGNFDKIDAFLDADVSTDIKDGYDDSEGDIIYLELINDTIPNLPPEVFLDHDPRSLKDEPENDYLKGMVKVFDLKIYEKIISLIYVRLPFEDRHYLSLTFVIRVYLPYLTYSHNSPLLLSFGSEDTIFDPDIAAFHFSSQEPMAYHWSGTFMCFNVYPHILYKSPMEICSSTRFNPNITMIWDIPSGESKVHM
nr:hypothetical protein [Tanacetum cinerariifolium]